MPILVLHGSYQSVGIRDDIHYLWAYHIRGGTLRAELDYIRKSIHLFPVTKARGFQPSVLALGLDMQYLKAASRIRSPSKKDATETLQGYQSGMSPVRLDFFTLPYGPRNTFDHMTSIPLLERLEIGEVEHT